MIQSSLLPVQITDIEPYNGNTARLKLVGYDASGRKYAIKRVSDSENGAIPINEWFGYNICRILGIATPVFDIVKISEEECFGSLWEDNVTIFSTLNNNPVEILSAITESKDSINRIICQDCFTCNPDRHFGNLIFKQMNSKLTALAFDWSESSGLTEVFITTNNQHQNTNTINTKNIMLQRFGLSNIYTSEIDRISQITHHDIKKIFDAAPKPWLTNIDISGIIEFWKNKIQMHASRVKQL